MLFRTLSWSVVLLKHLQPQLSAAPYKFECEKMASTGLLRSFFVSDERSDQRKMLCN